MRSKPLNGPNVLVVVPGPPTGDVIETFRPLPTFSKRILSALFVPTTDRASFLGLDGSGTRRAPNIGPLLETVAGEIWPGKYLVPSGPWRKSVALPEWVLGGAAKTV